MKFTTIIIFITALIFVILAQSAHADSNGNYLRFLQLFKHENKVSKRSNNYVQCWSQYGGKGRCCGTVDTRGVAIGNIDNHCTVQLGACCYGGADRRCHWQYGAVCP
ncbi:unnamed protein product [Adineta steineri]|uniref:Uncharacterized protein n=1 Tax=Adineta steineri TaxID=433720 RepID=A0A814LWL9_9BILA|nr:unnamed protein product [Adineta steineri]CAF1071289.1 unnamed protein product [Adineta steineri]